MKNIIGVRGGIILLVVLIVLTCFVSCGRSKESSNPKTYYALTYEAHEWRLHTITKHTVMSCGVNLDTVCCANKIRTAYETYLVIYEEAPSYLPANVIICKGE